VEALAWWHYEMSHLPRAINLPYEFVDEAEKVLPDKRAQIVVYCMNEECEASREEARELEEMGYRHILHYSPRRLLHGGPQRREVVVSLIPERDRSDPVYAVAQVAVDPGDVSWSGPFDQQTRYGVCRD
jgi:rhodanese-related sulfurtransferase